MILAASVGISAVAKTWLPDVELAGEAAGVVIWLLVVVVETSVEDGSAVSVADEVVRDRGELLDVSINEDEDVAAVNRSGVVWTELLDCAIVVSVAVVSKVDVVEATTNDVDGGGGGGGVELVATMDVLL